MKCKICGCTNEPLTRTNHTVNNGKLFCFQCKECGTSTRWSKDLRELRCSLFGNDEQNCRIKQTNPKDAVGVKKVSIRSVLPAPVLGEVALALMEGARKYGRHNYRIAGTRASVYIDACGRHIDDFWEGVDIDPDSGLSHVTKAISTLVVLRDSMLQGNWVDDRPPRSEGGWVQELNKKAEAIIEMYPEALSAHTEK